MTTRHEQSEKAETTYVNILLPGSWLERADREVVDRIAHALYDDPRTRTAIQAARGGEALEPRYVSLSELGERAQPAGVPLLNEAIGVLTTPAPEDGVGAVQTAIKDVAPPGTRVEQAVIERTLWERPSH